MAIDIPYRFAATGFPPSPQVQANFDRIVFSLQNSITTAGDITITGAGNGLVLTTPNGLHTWRIAISNDGNITTEQLT